MGHEQPIHLQEMPGAYHTQTLFHTNIRNVGLFASFGCALLGVSRFYMAKDLKMYNIGYIIISLFFMITAMLLAWFLIIDHKKYLSQASPETKELLEKWYILPKILLVGMGLFLLPVIHTLYRQL